MKKCRRTLHRPRWPSRSGRRNEDRTRVTRNIRTQLIAKGLYVFRGRKETDIRQEMKNCRRTKVDFPPVKICEE